MQKEAYLKNIASDEYRTLIEDGAVVLEDQARDRCEYRAWAGGCIILSVADWDFTVDSRAGTCRYLFGSVYDEQSSCSTGEGHLECLYHMFAYLKKYHNAEMIVYDPTEPTIGDQTFKKADWTYSNILEKDRTEVLPPNMPKPRGKGFVIRCYVDADHAGDSVTRKYCMVLLFISTMLLFIGIPSDRGALSLRLTRLSYGDEGGYGIHQSAEVQVEDDGNTCRGA